jgi:mannose-1-phosphate guanylyltransferase
VKALVLVGGEGTRLQPLTLTTPKPLLPIAGQAFLERQLAWLAHHGIDEVVLALGYLPDAFLDHFPEGSYEDVTLRYAVEPHPMGTAGAIRFAADDAGIDDRFVVCNGDVLTTLDLTKLVGFHADRGAEATIHLSQVEDPSAFGVVPTFDDGEVRAFVEKPAPGEAPTAWINAGTYVLEPSVLERIPKDKPVSIERDVFPRMLSERGHLFALGTTDYWIDIGTPSKYLEAHADVLAGRVGRPPSPGASEREPGVWTVDDSATPAIIEAPVLIGAQASIARTARIAASSVGARCVVGDGSVVEGSVLLAGAQLGAGARVIASIVGPDARIEAGAEVLETSVIGAAAHVPAGAHLTGVRIPTSKANT